MDSVGNTYPIVLVHGFAGWGRDELGGLKYWGGIQGDLQEQLRARGFTVFTAAVGPFSSNWDRACELYAQIKGGRVDYGANHAKFHGHRRFGRSFPGLFLQWGELGADGHVQKVHLVGHSMGGQTIRMLAQLLNKGSHNAPVEESSTAVEAQALFTGGKDWVHSITTIATPNKGALLADAFHGVSDLVKDTLVAVFSSLNILGDLSDDVYDAKLDQWDISPKRPGESLKQYLERVFDSPIFAPGVQDISLWSFSTGGAAEDRAWIETLANVYYFSYATVDTHASFDLFFRTVQKPNVFTMFLPLQPLGAYVGGRYAPDHGFSEQWQANDGVVNSFSMYSDGRGAYVVFEDVAQRGVWNGMPTLEPMDHIAVIGLTIHTNVLEKLYSAHAALLRTLPSVGEATLAHQQQQHDASEHVHAAAVALCAQVATAAAAEAARRQHVAVASEQDEYAQESRITFATWGPSHAVKPIPVLEQEP